MYLRIGSRNYICLTDALLSAHFRSTTVSLVGLQVWRGSLLLADFLLNHHSDLNISNARVIELAAGTGITSIVSAALGAKSVLCTGIQSLKYVVGPSLGPA